MKTSTQIGHRYIPFVEPSYDCVTCPKGPVANLDTADTRLILETTYTTTYDAYKNFNQIVRSASANRTCPPTMTVHYMENVQNALTRTPLGPPRKLLSTCHDSYQHVDRAPSMGCEGCLSFLKTSWPKPNCDEETSLPQGPEGKTRFLDPYFTTNRLYHRAFIPYAPEKTITFYSEVQEKKEKKPPDPAKNMCLGRGRADVRINYDRVIRRKPVPLKSDLTTTQRAHYPPPIFTAQHRTRDLMNVGIRWNDSPYVPFKCKLR